MRTRIFAKPKENIFRVRAEKQKITLALRPEKIVLEKSPQTGLENQITARVVDRIYAGAETQFFIEACGQGLRATAMNSKSGSELQIGDDVVIRLPPEALVLLED